MGTQRPRAHLQGQQPSQSGHAGPQAREARSSDISQEARNQGFYVGVSIVKPWLWAVPGSQKSGLLCRCLHRETLAGGSLGFLFFSPTPRAVQNMSRARMWSSASRLSPALGAGMVCLLLASASDFGPGGCLLPWLSSPHPPRAPPCPSPAQTQKTPGSPLHPQHWAVADRGLLLGSGWGWGAVKALSTDGAGLLNPSAASPTSGICGWPLSPAPPLLTPLLPRSLDLPPTSRTVQPPSARSWPLVPVAGFFPPECTEHTKPGPSPGSLPSAWEPPFILSAGM